MSNEAALVSIDAIAALAVAGLDVKDIQGVPHVVLPRDHSLQDLGHLLPAPTRIRKTLGIADVSSFIRYFSVFRSETTMIFSDEEKGTVRAMFDYHQPGRPSHCSHEAVLVLEESPEWALWKVNNAQKKSQIAFAEFIEDNISNIVDPDGATLLEIAKTLTATKKLNFRSSQQLDNGQVQLSYNEEIEGMAGSAGNIQIPQVIKLGVRIYKGQELYCVTARLRYRIEDGGKLYFSYHINDMSKLKEDSFNRVLAQIQEGCQAATVIAV